MTDDQFQTISDRAFDLQATESRERAWRQAIEEHVARVVANLKAQYERNFVLGRCGKPSAVRAALAGEKPE
jgi:hypothetical protein